MAEGFKDRTPDEQRALADSAMEDGFAQLTNIVQQLGICCLVAASTDRELRIINQRQNPLADDEFVRITHAYLTEAAPAFIKEYVATARRALRFDELEGADE